MDGSKETRTVLADHSDGNGGQWHTAISYIICGRSPAIPNQDLTSDLRGSLQIFIGMYGKERRNTWNSPEPGWALFMKHCYLLYRPCFIVVELVRLCASVVTLVSLSNPAGVLTLVDHLVVHF